MSLLHSRPVAAQRVYYKPSAMTRLKALLTPRHRTTTATTATTAAPPRTRRKRRAVRQPVRKTGLLNRSRPRRIVVTTTRRRPGFWASLRPHHRRRANAVPVRTYRRPRRSHRGSTLSAILAALSLKRRRQQHQRYRYQTRQRYY